MMNYNEYMVLFNPNSDEIIAAAWPEKSTRREYSRSIGACLSHVRKMNFEQRKTQMFIDAAHLIIRDGVCPEAVHRTFLQFEEYVDGCAEDMV